MVHYFLERRLVKVTLIKVRINLRKTTKKLNILNKLGNPTLEEGIFPLNADKGLQGNAVSQLTIVSSVILMIFLKSKNICLLKCQLDKEKSFKHELT